MSELRVRDHSIPCKHDIPGIDGFTWQDDSDNWFCDEDGCPGGREIRLEWLTDQPRTTWIER